jgi:hypothetical protein
VNNDVVQSQRNEVTLGVVAEPVEEADKGAAKKKVVSGVAEVALDVVAETVEEEDKSADKEKAAEAVAECGEANDVEKEKSNYIHRSIQSGKGPTVHGFYSERAAAASAKQKQQNRCAANKNEETSKKKKPRSRSSFSSSSSSSNVSSVVSICCLDVKLLFLICIQFQGT